MLLHLNLPNLIYKRWTLLGPRSPRPRQCPWHSLASGWVCTVLWARGLGVKRSRWGGCGPSLERHRRGSSVCWPQTTGSGRCLKENIWRLSISIALFWTEEFPPNKSCEWWFNISKIWDITDITYYSFWCWLDYNWSSWIFQIGSGSHKKVHQCNRWQKFESTDRLVKENICCGNFVW